MSADRRLTGKEQAFADRIIAGDGPSAAYVAAGYAPSSPRIIAVAAQRNLHRPAVAAYIAAARSKSTARALVSRDRKREVLTDLIEDGKLKPLERIAAIKADNEMTGDNAPLKVAHSGIGEIIALVRSNSKR